VPRSIGSCHCGRVRLEIDAAIDRVTQCNCSVCAKQGILHHRVVPGKFRLLSGGEHLATDQFGARAAKHHFCTVCGSHTLTGPRTAPDLYTVNIRYLENFDLASHDVEIVQVDGSHWETEARTRQ